LRGLAQAVTSGLLIGAVYGLIALGLNIVFGTMRVVNFAQGTLLMAGMFMTYWLWELGGVHPYISPLVTVPPSIPPASGLHGITPSPYARHAGSTSSSTVRDARL